MQVVKPIDIEDALRTDLGAFMTGTVCAPPAPDALQAGTVCVTSVGGRSQTQVSHAYDVSVDCWAATEAAAIQLANDAAGAVASLPWRDLASGRVYVTADINATPYLNPDPYRPMLPRATFRANVGIRGASVFNN